MLPASRASISQRIFPVFHAPHTTTASTSSPDSVIVQMVRSKVDYVILEQLGYSSTPRYLLPAIQHRPDLFPIAWQLPNPDTYLLRFERDKAAAILTNTETQNQ